LEKENARNTAKLSNTSIDEFPFLSKLKKINGVLREKNTKP